MKYLFQSLNKVGCRLYDKRAKSYGHQGSILTLIAYRFTVDLLVPKDSNLTKHDEFILGRDKAVIALFLPHLEGKYGQMIVTDQLTLEAWRSP